MIIGAYLHNVSPTKQSINGLSSHLGLYWLFLVKTIIVCFKHLSFGLKKFLCLFVTLSLVCLVHQCNSPMLKFTLVISESGPTMIWSGSDTFLTLAWYYPKEILSWSNTQAPMLAGKQNFEIVNKTNLFSIDIMNTIYFGGKNSTFHTAG